MKRNEDIPLESKEMNQENLDQIIEAVSAWKNDDPSTYYDPNIDSRGYIPSRSAREILQELGLEV